MILALEELGMNRYGSNKSLFKVKPKSNLVTQSYIVITGNKTLSPNNVKEISAVKG